MRRNASETALAFRLSPAQPPKQESIPSTEAPWQLQRRAGKSGATCGMRWLGGQSNCACSVLCQVELDSPGQELWTRNDALHQSAEAITVGLKFHAHIVDQGIVRKLQSPS